MTEIGVVLYCCPILAFILHMSATRHHPHLLPMIIFLSMGLVAAVLVVHDYLSCIFAFAELSPIFGIEYSYEPHDGVVFAAFADVVISLVWLPICLVRYVHFRKKRAAKRAEYRQFRQENMRSSEGVDLR